MSEWLERLRTLVRTHDRAPDTAQSRRVEAALIERALFASDAQRIEVVLAAIGDEPLDARSLDHLVATLKAPGFSSDLTDEETEAHLRLWRTLTARRPDDDILSAHVADIEMTLGDAGAALRRFLDTFDRRPDLFFEFGWDLEDVARTEGGDVLFRWQLHHLRWFIQNAGDPNARDDNAGDEAREIYGELLDEYRDQPARLAALHPLGAEIRRREATGELPRAMVVRRRRSRDEG